MVKNLEILALDDAGGGEEHPCTSEEDVFAFVGLRYLEPQDRR
jgi:hypothetical protein